MAGKVKRYDPIDQRFPSLIGAMAESEYGDYVHISDFLFLERQNKELKEMLQVAILEFEGK